MLMRGGVAEDGAVNGLGGPLADLDVRLERLDLDLDRAAHDEAVAQRAEWDAAARRQARQVAIVEPVPAVQVAHAELAVGHLDRRVEVGDERVDDHAVVHRVSTEANGQLVEYLARPGLHRAIGSEHERLAP